MWRQFGQWNFLYLDHPGGRICLDAFVKTCRTTVEGLGFIVCRFFPNDMKTYWSVYFIKKKKNPKIHKTPKLCKKRVENRVLGQPVARDCMRALFTVCNLGGFSEEVATEWWLKCQEATGMGRCASRAFYKSTVRAKAWGKPSLRNSKKSKK